MANSLFEALMETEAGRYANAIGNVLYFSGDRLDKSDGVLLQAARAYLEKIALDELGKAHPWVREFVQRAERGDG